MKAVLSLICLAVPVAAVEIAVMTAATNVACPSAVVALAATGAEPARVALPLAILTALPPAVVPGVVVQPQKLPPVPPALLAKLSSTDVNVVTDAIAQIDYCDTNTRAVRTAFIGLLSHTSLVVRVAALDVIAFFDVKEPFVPALATCLNDAHEDVRSAACDILFEVQTKEALDVFIVNLTNQYEDVRSTSEDNVEYHTTTSMPSAAAWRAWWSTNRASFEF